MSADGISEESSHIRRYQRELAARERAVRQKHPKLGSAILAVTRAPKSSRRHVKRAKLMEEVGNSLSGLETHGLIVLHDRAIPGTTGSIEHFVIGNNGVTVVRATNSKGRIRVTKNDIFVGGTKLTVVANGLHSRVDTVRHMLGGESNVHGALALPKVTKNVAKHHGNITVGSVEGVFDHMLTLHAGSPPGLDLRKVAGDLDDVFIPASMLG